MKPPYLINPYCTMHCFEMVLFGISTSIWQLIKWKQICPKRPVPLTWFLKLDYSLCFWVNSRRLSDSDAWKNVMIVYKNIKFWQCNMIYGKSGRCQSTFTTSIQLRIEIPKWSWWCYWGWCAKIRAWPWMHLVLAQGSLLSTDHGSLSYYATCSSLLRPVMYNALVQWHG